VADKKDAVDPWERLGIRPTSIGQVAKLLDIVWEMPQKLTICLVGETGIGKTPVVHQWCTERKGFMRVLNFGHMSQEEISMIMFSEDATNFDFVPPKFLIELNEAAEEYGLAVLFLDEWNRGDKALVNSLFTLTDERRIHNFRLHKNVIVVAAMNPSDGSYLVNEAEKDHAIRKRLNFVYVTHDLAAWLAYVSKSGWHQHVPAFIKAATTFLYDAGMRDAGKAFPCPSNWEKVSNILLAAERAKLELASDPVRTLVEGQIGNVAATKFMDFVADQNTLIQPIEILNDYKTQSNVRKRVAALLNMSIDRDTSKLVEKAAKTSSRTAVVQEVCAGVALELFSTRPDATKVAPQLALFIGDLPNEILSLFVGQQLKSQSDAAGAEGEKYMNRISSALQGYAPYKEKMGVIVTALRNYKQQAGIGADGATKAV